MRRATGKHKTGKACAISGTIIFCFLSRQNLSIFLLVSFIVFLTIKLKSVLVRDSAGNNLRKKKPSFFKKRRWMSNE